ncbi:MAG: DUF4838 domain-containing protein [Bacteroidetes bacterium]|nr:MAG: DUF4838 domain-containing protein [Bacteroidota bacterium]
MKNTLLLLSIVLLSTSCNWASDFPVVINKTSAYAIVVPEHPTPHENKAAKALQHYILLSTGTTLLVANETVWKDKPGLFIGNTQKSKTVQIPEISGEGYFMGSDNQDVIIYGKQGKGVIYGTYAFIEKYLGGIKLADEPGKVAEYKQWELPANFSYSYSPQMVYRQAYYPQSNDPEYLDWHGLHKFDDLWGLWGHSYFKLVNPGKYFKTHPEYFALENGMRKPTQLCVSNAEVAQIAIEELRIRMADNPDALYWSVSAEDDLGYCRCDKCHKVNTEEGTPTGAHLRFVNKIAKAFPDKMFTTLAYTYTIKAPAKTSPLPNVYILLSTIDAYRTNPIEKEPSAASFRAALEAWEKLTHRLFIWDYTTQFTNYLAPFPDIYNLGANIKYFQQHHVKGVFSQGCGDTYGEMAELKSYLIAKLLWNPDLDATKLLNDFCDNYYKSGSKYVLEYIRLLQEESRKTNRHIDIYGNPINEFDSYLSPVLLDQFSTLFDKAEGAVEELPKVLDRIYKLRMPFDYVVLQQARFYGMEKFGYLIPKEDDNTYVVNPKILGKVEKFVATAERYKVTELSEGGLTPKQYLEEWKNLIALGWKPNLATNSTITLKYPFTTEYPAKKERTLTDGARGLKDFSYNWLCFYGVDMVVNIDMESNKEVRQITMNFLDDPRHWIFLPENIEVKVSVDGQNFTVAKPAATNMQLGPSIDEHYETTSVPFQFNIKPQLARYVQVTVKNRSGVPEWRFRPNKKAMLACDEIYVN